MARMTQSTSTTEATAPSPNLGDTRERVLELLKDIPQTYEDLINAGRQQEAFQLRDAQERLASLGSRAGIGSQERVAILTDMQNAMRTAASVTEGGQQTDRLARTDSALRLLASLDESAFNQTMTEYKENIRLDDKKAAAATPRLAKVPSQIAALSARAGARAVPAPRPAASTAPRLRSSSRDRPLFLGKPTGDQVFRAQVQAGQAVRNAPRLNTNQSRFAPTLTPSPFAATVANLPSTRVHKNPSGSPALQGAYPNRTGFTGSRVRVGREFQLG